MELMWNNVNSRKLTADLDRKSTRALRKVRSELTMGFNTIRQGYVSAGHITYDPAAILTPIPEVVRQVCTKDAIEQVIEPLVAGPFAIFNINAESFLDVRCESERRLFCTQNESILAR